MTDSRPPTHFQRLRQICETSLSMQERWLLVLIDVHIGENIAAFPSVQKLASMAGLSVSSIHDYIRKLKDLGILKTKRRRNHNALRWIDWGVQELQPAGDQDLQCTGDPKSIGNQDLQPTGDRELQPAGDPLIKDSLKDSLKDNRKAKTESGKSAKKKTKKPKSRKHWHSDITLDDFQSLDKGLEFFNLALEAGALSDADRLDFLTNWRSISRAAADGSLSNPAAVLVSRCRDRERLSSWGSDADEVDAQAFLIEWMRSQPLPDDPFVSMIVDAFTDPEAEAAYERSLEYDHPY